MGRVKQKTNSRQEKKEFKYLFPAPAFFFFLTVQPLSLLTMAFCKGKNPMGNSLQWCKPKKEINMLMD